MIVNWPCVVSKKCKIVGLISLAVVACFEILVGLNKLGLPLFIYQQQDWNTYRVFTPAKKEQPYQKLFAEIEDELKLKLQNATDKKIILVWIPMFNIKEKVAIDAKTCGNCELTFDRNMIDDKRTGAVVFHFDAFDPKNLPANRNLDQLYIYWYKESSATLRVTRGMSLNIEDSFGFNATMTYRRDSDFYDPYDVRMPVHQIVEKNDLSLPDLIKQKTKMSIAVLSNCDITARSKQRLSMLKELKNDGLDLDFYGDCFGTRLANENFKSEVRKHKFYFSFENSLHCKDYITEKFFSNALQNLAVPVVWGATKADYEAVAPPGSFIFAEDFSSMKVLARYLQFLNKNDTAYLEYFTWLTMKPEDMPHYGRQHWYCSVCRALHGINVDDVFNPNYDRRSLKRPLFTNGIARRTIPSLKKWFYDVENEECFAS